MFDGTNIPQNKQCTLLASNTSATLLPPGETAVPCGSIGGMGCQIISPSVGILGTPAIDENKNVIYLVTFSTDGTNYYHRIHAPYTGLVSGQAALA